MSKRITRKQLEDFLRPKSKEWIVKEYIKLFNRLERYKKADDLQALNKEIESNLDWSSEDVVNYLKNHGYSKKQILKMYPHLSSYYDSKRKL